MIGENLDDIIGVAYLKDVTKRVFDRHEAESTERVESVMRPVMYVPDSKPVDELLREMQAERKHVAVVVDEYGGTAGLVTIEDVLEEIVGEITDEYDQAEVEVERLANGAVRVSSRFPVDDLDEVVRRRDRGRRRRHRRRADGQAPRPGADRRLRGRGARAALRGRGARPGAATGSARSLITPARAAERRGQRATAESYSDSHA